MNHAPLSSDPFEGTAYQATSYLGTRGTGDLFVVRHCALGKQFTAKLLQSRNDEFVDRLRVEAQALGALQHPHIAEIKGFGVTKDDQPFIIMEHLDGLPFSDELAQVGSFPAFDAVTYALEVLSGLDAAHAKGLVHRGIGPDCIFACQKSDRRIAKIADFGCVRVLPGRANIDPPVVPTRAGAIVGPPAWMSPEAAAGQAVDRRADVYGVGLFLYALLTGRNPFQHGAAPGNAASVAPPSHIAHQAIPSALDSLILKALQLDPAQRWQNCSDFHSALVPLHRQLAPGQLRTATISSAIIRQWGQREPVPAAPSTDSPEKAEGRSAHPPQMPAAGSNHPSSAERTRPGSDQAIGGAHPHEDASGASASRIKEFVLYFCIAAGIVAAMALAGYFASDLLGSRQ